MVGSVRFELLWSEAKKIRLMDCCVICLRGGGNPVRQPYTG